MAHVLNENWNFVYFMFLFRKQNFTSVVQFLLLLLLFAHVSIDLILSSVRVFFLRLIGPKLSIFNIEFHQYSLSCQIGSSSVSSVQIYTSIFCTNFVHFAMNCACVWSRMEKYASAAWKRRSLAENNYLVFYLVLRY